VLSSFQLFLELLVTEQGRAVVHVHQEYSLLYNDLRRKDETQASSRFGHM
jgi:hypothetical protein